MSNKNSHILTLTDGDIKNNKIRFTPCGREFFPEDAFGASTGDPQGKPITIILDGLNKNIKTDLPLDKNGRTPRWFCRDKTWVKSFIEHHSLKAGSKLVINKLTARKYALKPFDRNNLENESLKVLSLFSGCGGMDLGLEGGFDVFENCVNTKIHKDWIESLKNGRVYLKKTGFKTVFANDIMPSAKVAWEQFFKKRGHSEGVFKYGSIVDLVKRHQNGEKIFPDNIDLVTGGFPCQDFSNSGKRNGFNSHRNHNNELYQSNEPTIENRGKLYMWLRKVVEITQPKMFIAENVKALITLDKTRDIIEKDFQTIGGGYVVLSKVLRAIEFGVPQTRERIFFIGLRKDALRNEALESLVQEKNKEKYYPFPRVTHKRKNDFVSDSSLKPVVSSGKVLCDLPEPNQNSNDIAQSTYSGAKYYGKHCQGNIEIDLNNPSFTIRAHHHGNIEFRRLSKKNGGKIIDELNAGLPERRLTVRECARLQTFPDDFEFVIKPKTRKDKNKLSGTEGYVLIGNAVPPLLAYNVAINIKSKWKNWFKGRGEF